MIKKLLQAAILCLIITGCEQKTAPERIPVGNFALKKTQFADLNGFEQDDSKDILHAFQLSCSKILSREDPFIGRGKIKIPTELYKPICFEAMLTQPQDFKAFIKDKFTPYAVIYNDHDKGKFTSYYESELHASYQKSDKYKYPVYGRPDDLIEFNPHDFDPTMPSKRLVGRIENQKLVPYYTREEIFNSSFPAPVILWADSYIDLYIMQIQGSAVAKLDDGSEVRIGYADTNGRSFKGIGSILLENKLLKPGQASMGSIKKWLKANPDIAIEQMNKNQRYVFHRINHNEGPIGALGVPLTAGRSLAVDRDYIPLGTLLWLETTGPQNEKIHKMVAAQDIGGAIKGAIRGDYFYGSGNDEILELAGKMNSSGRYFILLPKEMKVDQYDSQTATGQ